MQVLVIPMTSVATLGVGFFGIFISPPYMLLGPLVLVLF